MRSLATLQLCLVLAMLMLLSAATSVVTTTVTESAACQNFVGACVVFPTAGDPAPATTAPPLTATTATATTTKTVYLSNSATSSDFAASNACADFTGACVIYGSNTDGASAYTTVNDPASSSAAAGGGGNNGEGTIALTKTPDNPGYIAAAPPLSMWTIAPIIGLALLNLGFVLFM